MPSAKVSRGKVEKRPSKKPTKSAARRKAAVKAVAIDQLAWTSVELPDTLEDAEGFYGLEEISGVNVVRDESGRVEYRIEVDEPEGGDEQDSSWEGFSDTAADGISREEQQAPQKQKEKSNNADNGLESALSKNAFDILQDEVEVEGADVSEWGGIGLSDDLLSAISRLQHTKPTPIQAAAIPEIISGRDVIGKAPTGSGKTLAFGIPIVERFLSLPASPEKTAPEKNFKDFHPLALIIPPTRELARQIERHIGELCSSLPTRPGLAMLTGGLSLHKQQRVLAHADIVIATPGRLWDFISSVPGVLKGLRQMQFLVVDEADRLLSDGHFKEVEQILESLERKETSEGSEEGAPATSYQTLVFSATFSPNLHQSLAGKSSSAKPDSLSYLLQKLPFHDSTGKPKFLDLNPATTSQLAPRLRTAILSCGAMEKDLHLYALLLTQPPGTKTLVFVNSISAVRRLAPLLQYLNLPAHGLHSQMQQRARLQTLERFAAASPSAAKPQTKAAATAPTRGAVLVATDVAARGLDIPAVQLVVHYHAPRAADGYIHRSGRTARAHASGSSVLLCAPEEVVPVRRLVAKVHAKAGADGKQGLKQIELDRTMVARLKPRVSLAQRITDAEIAGEKERHEDGWVKQAAADLGVDLDDGLDDLEDDRKGGRGRGKGGRGAGVGVAVGQGQLRAWKAELKQDLGRRVNVGVSEKYLTAGGVDVASLLRGDGGDFLGSVKTIEMDFD